MKKKIISLALAFLLPLVACSSIGSASYQDNVSDAQIEELQQKLEKLKKKKQQQQPMQVEVKKHDPSILEIIAGIVKASLGFIFGITATIFVTAPISILAFAASDCSKDEKCHIDNKTFLDKVKKNANWKTAMIPAKFILKHVNFILDISK